MTPGTAIKRPEAAGPATSWAGFFGRPQAPVKGAKEGAILVLSIILIVLMTMVAIGVAMNTTGELSVSSNTDNGRKAFIQADSALKISLLISRILLFHPGHWESFIKTDAQTIIKVDEDDFDLALLRWNMEDTSYTERYIAAGGKSTGITHGGTSYKPVITFERKSASDPTRTRVVATSAVSLDYSESSLIGISSGQPTYGSDSTGLRTIIIVTTDGRVPIGSDSASSEESSFFDGTADTTHAILSSAFQEVQ